VQFVAGFLGFASGHGADRVRESNVKVVFRNKSWELKGGMTARDAVKKVGLDPQAVLVTRDGELVTDDTILKDGDEVKLIAVVSGGTVVSVCCLALDQGN